ncbi:DMT family transporter [Macrococcoides bohemicum]|uniref:DMT family transporter n=1 Tax=Macrococcoides bohemicum TaxID=1903056 RepID=UPI0021CD803C|nr:DMT family transporter [Macrococcus bohemicus]
MVVLSLIWGSQFMFMALITQEGNPVFISFIKATIGTLFLSLLSFLFKQENYKKQWKLYILIALFEVVIPFVLIAIGQKFVDSGITSVIMGLVPVFTLLILFLTTSKKMKTVEVISVATGFLGIIIISWRPTNFNMYTLVGILCLLLAVLSFSVSLVLMKNLISPTPVLHMRNILGISSICLFILLFCIPNGFDFQFNGMQWSVLVILGVVHSAVAYVIYNSLVSNYDPLLASFTNYLVPIVGLLLGVLCLNESLNNNSLFGITMIFISIIISQKTNKNKC